MKNLIKSTCFILACAVLAVCLASCGESGENSAAVSQTAEETSEPAAESSEEIPEASAPTAEGKRLLYKISSPVFGDWTVYDYNERGDIVTEEYSDGMTKYYTYDDSGRISRTDVKNGGGSVSASEKWEYDENGRLFRYTSWSGSLSTYEYVYDDAGKIAKATVTNSSGSYDELYEYAEDGSYSVKSDLPNGTRLERRFNANGDIVSVFYDGVKQNEYTYDADGILIRYESFYNSEVWEYTAYRYGENGVLTEEEISPEPGSVHYKRYEYDESGDRVKTIYISAVGEERVLEECEYKVFDVVTE